MTTEGREIPRQTGWPPFRPGIGMRSSSTGPGSWRTITKQAIPFDGRVVGNIVCFEQGGSRLVGYWIGPEYWGRSHQSALRVPRPSTASPPLRPCRRPQRRVHPVLETCGLAISEEATETSRAAAEEAEELVLELEA
jgi:hypothetical protein